MKSSTLAAVAVGDLWLRGERCFYCDGHCFQWDDVIGWVNISKNHTNCKSKKLKMHIIFNMNILDSRRFCACTRKLKSKIKYIS